MSKQQIEALLIERAGYAQRKLTARVAAVDAALAALGHKTDKVETAAVDHAPETASAPRRPKRTTNG